MFFLQDGQTATAEMESLPRLIDKPNNSVYASFSGTPTTENVEKSIHITKDSLNGHKKNVIQQITLPPPFQEQHGNLNYIENVESISE